MKLLLVAATALFWASNTQSTAAQKVTSIISPEREIKHQIIGKGLNDEERHYRRSSSSRCGCSSCDSAILSLPADGPSVENRIDWVIRTEDKSESEACEKVCGIEYTELCGDQCAPSKCGAAPDNGAANLGLCYGYGTAQPSLEEKVNNDMAVVANCPATSEVKKIRTYFPSFYGKKVTDFAAFAGKRLLPGFNPRDSLTFKAALDGDLRTVYGESDVEAIIYLNEQYGDDDRRWAEEFIGSMSSIRTGKPILTSQKLVENYGVFASLLAKGFDGIMINIYPSPLSADPEEDFRSFCSFLKEITDYYTTHSGRGENFYGVSETGVPAYTVGPDVVKAYYERVRRFVAGQKNCPEFSYAELVNLNGGPTTWLGIYGFEATSESIKCCSASEKSFGITDAICPASEVAEA